MKKLFFVGTIAVLMCSSCDWFGNKPNNNDDGTVIADSLSMNPDTVLTEMPESSSDGTQLPISEKETATEKTTGK